MSPDSLYQDAVDREIDRLARLSACELMRLEPKSWKVETEFGAMELTCMIHDWGEVRHIAVLADKPVLLGLARKRFVAGIKVTLSYERMSDAEAADLYD